ncbi:MAG: S49 family peptidase [Mesorhizobium sp.]|nr:MAG: S49 family peptidase [Mesorhizobium sp.]
MAHEINRLLRAFASQPWFIEPRKAEQIIAALELRANYGVRAEPYRAEPAQRPKTAEPVGNVTVLRLYGPILPRAEAVKDISQASALMTEFQQAFRSAAADPNVGAIILDIDSPGGQVDLVPETAAMIRAARRADRPIVAVANTLAASAAYWIASAADEIVVTPSGEVGSIGVYTVHEDVSELLAAEGVRVTFISEGPRKVEANPFEPLGTEARAALQANVRHFYDMFVSDVAKGRGVSTAIVKADPEKSDKHFGGGRVYPGKQAVELGMADKVATLDETITRLQRGNARGGRRADVPTRLLAFGF